MIQYHVFPGGKKRIVTFSYDDGHEKDKRLLALFHQYGVKGTFHLNGKNYTGLSEEERKEVHDLYQGHEISCHTFSHGWPERMPSVSIVNEVMKDRLILEKIAGYPVIGMSYPSGSYSPEAIEAMKACGIVYSRTVDEESDFRFQLPKDFMTWHPTCHHKKAQAYAEKFMSGLDSQWEGPLLYIWGHSHEFVTEQDWSDMETLVKTVAGNEKIWYASNIEIWDYLQAQKQLKISADETCFHNPTAIEVWVEKDKKDLIKIGPGETVTV